MVKHFLPLVLWPIVLCTTNVCHESECVSRNNGASARISAAQPAEPNMRPFQVALYKRVGTTGALGFCGGSLIHPEWVLTAAHCAFHDGVEVDNVQAILGAHSLYDRYENGRRIVDVSAIVLHPGWDASSLANDIALMRLANVVQLTDTIDVIQLPYRNISAFNFAGIGATVSGWGIPAEGVTFISPTLREKLMTVTTDTLCNSFYASQLPENTVCAFDASGASGTCKGDNGGPLTIFYNPTEETLLIGVTSFVGISGCTVDRPSVFTRVQRHLDWIEDTTGMTII